MRFQPSIYITISTFTSVRLSGGVLSHPSNFEFLQSYHKMSLTKVSWNVLRVRNMHFGSPSDSLGSRGKVKPNYVYYMITQKLCISNLMSVFLHLPSSVSPKQLCALTHLESTQKVGTSYWNRGHT